MKKTLLAAALLIATPVAMAQISDPKPPPPPVDAAATKAPAKKPAPKKTVAKKPAPPKKPVAAAAPKAPSAPGGPPNVTVYKSSQKMPPTLRDKDGNLIPTSPDAYDVSSAVGKKK